MIDEAIKFYPQFDFEYLLERFSSWLNTQLIPPLEYFKYYCERQVYPDQS